MFSLELFVFTFMISICQLFCNSVMLISLGGCFSQSVSYMDELLKGLDVRND